MVYKIVAESGLGIILTDTEGREMRIETLRQLGRNISYLERCAGVEDAQWYPGVEISSLIFRVEMNKCQTLVSHLRHAEKIAFPSSRKYSAEF